MTSPLVRVASCSCGQLRATARGEPVRVSVCHCLACQKRTGSAFGAQARFPREAVTIEGRAGEHVRVADSGSRVRFRFCPECGSTVAWELEALPSFVAVALGAFAGDAHPLPAPTVSVYEARAHAWAPIAGDGVEHHD